jgi:hypothetical protein
MRSNPTPKLSRGPTGGVTIGLNHLWGCSAILEHEEPHGTQKRICHQERERQLLYTPMEHAVLGQWA